MADLEPAAGGFVFCPTGQMGEGRATRLWTHAWVLLLLQICASPGVGPRLEMFLPTQPICERTKAVLTADELVREHPGVWECRPTEVPRHAEACSWSGN